MKLGLDGTTVFVSGSSRGIGLAVVRAFLDEGANVTLTGRDEVSLKKAHAELSAAHDPGKILVHRGDLCEVSVIRDAVDAALVRWGKIDCLVASVGTGVIKTGWDIGDDEWQRGLMMNFHASVRLVEAVTPHMVEQNGGAIVAIGSIAGVESLGAPLPYGSAKAALSHYVGGLAREIGPNKVRVNCIAPGNIMFPGGRWEEKVNEKPDFFKKYVEQEVPLQRFGAPEEIADLAVFLCSNRSSFITGATIVSDGGQTRSVF